MNTLADSLYKPGRARRSLGRWLLWALAWAVTLPAGAATQTVTNTNDSGPGSLRQTIASAASGDTIQFSLPNPSTITLSSTLTIATNLTINGPGASQLAISGNHKVQVFVINSGVTATLAGVTIENGNSNYSGGIFNKGTLTVTNSTLSGNSATYEYGGISNSGTLTVTNSTVSGNSATDSSGGIFNGGTLTLTNSTVSGNSATAGFGNAGGIDNNGTLTVTNSTVSGNSAGGYGGGIDNFGTLTLTNSTLSGNSATNGSGIASGHGGTFTLKSTILANAGSGGNCSLAGGAILSQGYNLSDDSSCSAAFTQTGDENNVVTGAGLDPKGLQNNGGPTQTIALLPTSPAVDAIPVANCTDPQGNPVATDQRGIARPQGKGCDSGAFELVQTVPFSSFSAQLQLATGKLAGFSVEARFTLGSGSPSLTPATQALTLTVGSYTLTLPAGTLQAVQVGPYSSYVYGGTVNNVKLDVVLLPLGNNSYGLQVGGTPVTLTSNTKSVPVTLTIGENTGTTTVTPLVLH